MKPLPGYSIRFLVLGFSLSACLTGTFLLGQGSPTYPYVSPTAAASGMTSGLENGASSSTMNMMQVRAAAQEADRAAAAAAMARSAETAIEEQGLKTALDKARQTRQAKIRASEQLKWKRATAYNAYNSVSSTEMATWKDANGRVKVGRGLPDDFVNTVRAEEAARAAAAPKKKGFASLKNIGDKVTEAVGMDEPDNTGLTGPKPLPQAPAPSQGREGRFGINAPKLNIPKIKAPKLFSKIGNRRQDTLDMNVPATAPGYSTAAPNRAVAPSGPAASATASSVASSAPARAAVSASKPKPVTIQQSRSAADMIRSEAGSVGSSQKKSGGLFSKKSGSDSKLFSFGKKKNQQVQPVVSSGLFPTGMVPTQPGGSAPAPNLPPPSSGRTIVSLPGSSPEPKKRFSLPKPKFSVPKVSSGSSGTSPTSTVNRNGNDFYVVNSAAQFMEYGSSRTDTTIRALGPGTVVRMTKPGADWATVQLPNGSSGVIQVKNLRGASAGEASSSN